MTSAQPGGQSGKSTLDLLRYSGKMTADSFCLGAGDAILEGAVFPW